MRTPLNIEEDALLIARQHATRKRVSVGEAARQAAPESPLKGRLALLPKRGDVITSAQVRELIDREDL